MDKITHFVRTGMQGTAAFPLTVMEQRCSFCLVGRRRRLTIV